MADLITLREAREQFAQTEPLAAASFATLADSDRKAPYTIYDDKWRYRTEDAPVTEPVPVWLVVPELGKTFQLTFQAAQQLGSTCRIPQDLQVSIPSDHVQNLVNWFLADPRGLGERLLKLLISPQQGQDDSGKPCPLAVAQTRATVQPFSNLTLLDEIQKVISAKYGSAAATRAVAHFTMHHDLEHTDCCVVVPDASRGIAGEQWAPGLMFTNSCIGLKQTTATGALVRMDSSGVVLDGAHSAGGFKRLNSTPDEAYEWMGEAASDCLRALDEIGFGNVKDLADMPIGEHAGTFVESLCNEFRVPKAQLERITAVLEEWTGPLTMYELVGIISRLANMEGLNWRAVSQLQVMSGHVVHSEGARCTAGKPCYRALPPGFILPS